MQGYAIQQSTANQPLVFLLVSSTDHVSPVTGATPTVTLSKNGGAYAGPAGAVTEIGNGMYKVAPNATDSNTFGPLLLHATASGADPCDTMFSVVAYNPLSATNLGLTNLDATVSSRSTYAGGAVASVTGNVGGNVVGSVGSISGVSFPTNFGSLSIDASGRVDLGKILGTASAGAAGYVGVDWAHVNAPTTAVNLSGTTISTGQAVASVSGAVGSVTGNVGGNVVGSVSSVTGAVGSVTAAVSVSLTETLSTPRALDSIADASVTLNDALWCAVAAAAGKEDASSGTSMVVKTPSTGTTLRTFTITTAATNPFGSNYPVSRT